MRWCSVIVWRYAIIWSYNDDCKGVVWMCDVISCNKMICGDDYKVVMKILLECVAWRCFVMMLQRYCVMMLRENITWRCCVNVFVLWWLKRWCVKIFREDNYRGVMIRLREGVAWWLLQSCCVMRLWRFLCYDDCKCVVRWCWVKMLREDVAWKCYVKMFVLWCWMMWKWFLLLI